MLYLETIQGINNINTYSGTNAQVVRENCSQPNNYFIN